nr:hypothetical protein [Tanacetum cinerariifolium]
MPVHITVKDIRTMDITIVQQVALDKDLVPHASRLRIGKSNFHLRSDITSKESTLQLVEMLHICLRLPNKTFDELPFEEEIQAFLRYLGHSGELKKITDVNINKLHQPWRSFAAEDFVYQVEYKDAKKSNEMYYSKFTKVIIQLFMTKDPSILRRNKFGAMLPVELTNEDIRNSTAYKEYYAIASGEAPPKTKASVKKTNWYYTRVPNVPTDESDEEISWKSSDEDDDDEVDDRSDDREDDDDQDDDDQDDNDDDQDPDNDSDDTPR